MEQPFLQIKRIFVPPGVLHQQAVALKHRILYKVAIRKNASNKVIAVHLETRINRINVFACRIQRELNIVCHFRGIFRMCKSVSRKE